MKKKIIRVLATIGLVIAIFLILKGVFDIGKIGIKSFSSNKNIIFEKCYDTDEFSSYKKSVSASDFENRNFEIDLSKDIVTRTVVWKDETIKINKEKNNFIMPKVELDTFRLVSKTKDFAKTESLGGIMGNDSYYTFFLNSGKMQLFHSLSSGENIVVNFNCKA